MKEESPFMAGDSGADNRGDTILMVIEKIFDILHPRMLNLSILEQILLLYARRRLSHVTNLNLP